MSISEDRFYYDWFYIEASSAKEAREYCGVSPETPVRVRVENGTRTYAVWAKPIEVYDSRSQTIDGKWKRVLE